LVTVSPQLPSPSSLPAILPTAALVERHDAFEEAARALIAAKRSPETRRAYSADLNRWLRFACERGIAPETATLADATAFREHELAGRQPSSVHRTLAALSSLYAALWRTGIAAGNPFHPGVLAWPSASPRRPTPAVRDDVVRRLLDACGRDADGWLGARDRLLIELLWASGLRRSSLGNLLVSDVDLGHSEVVLRPIIKGGDRGEVVLPVELGEQVRAWVARLGDSSGPLFPRAEGSAQAIGGGGLYRLLRRRARAAGVDVQVAPHQFRAALATAAYDAGLPEYEVQAALHHASASTTRRYDRGRRGARAISAVELARRGRGTST
jgi:integrase/recombinase XerC